MNTLTSVIHYLLPVLSLLLLAVGIIKHHVHYVLIALWVTLIILVLHYYHAGNEILGPYFDYQNAAIYTLSLLVLNIALFYLILYAPVLRTKYIRHAAAFLGALLVTSSILLIINLWINAYFIENRLKDTVVMQVVSFTPPAYCDHEYLFYKIDPSGHVGYLCPNHYGLIPAIGALEIAPDFIAKQLLLPPKLRQALQP